MPCATCRAPTTCRLSLRPAFSWCIKASAVAARACGTWTHCMLIVWRSAHHWPLCLVRRPHHHCWPPSVMESSLAHREHINHCCRCTACEISAPALSYTPSTEVNAAHAEATTRRDNKTGTLLHARARTTARADKRTTSTEIVSSAPAQLSAQRLSPPGGGSEAPPIQIQSAQRKKRQKGTPSHHRNDAQIDGT